MQILQSGYTSSDENTAISQLARLTDDNNDECVIFILKTFNYTNTQKSVLYNSNNTVDAILMLQCVMFVKIKLIKNIDPISVFI